MRPKWGPPGSCRFQMGPMNLAIRDRQNYSCLTLGIGLPLKQFIAPSKAINLWFTSLPFSCSLHMLLCILTDDGQVLGETLSQSPCTALMVAAIGAVLGDCQKPLENGRYSHQSLEPTIHSISRQPQPISRPTNYKRVMWFKPIRGRVQ